MLQKINISDVDSTEGWFALLTVSDTETKTLSSKEDTNEEPM